MKDWILKFGIGILLIALIYGLGYQTARHDFPQLITLYSIFFLLYLGIYQFTTTKKTIAFFVGLSILLRLLLVFTIPNFSDDLYRFIWDGRLLTQGINPFDHLPSYYIDNNVQVAGLTPELYQLLNSPNYFTIYPPINQLLFAIATSVFPNSIWGSSLVMKSFLFAFEIGSIFLIIRLLQHFKLPAKNVLLYALNPLIIFEITGNLHFEGAMIFFLLLAIWLVVVKKWWLLSAFAFALSVASKLLPLMFLPLFARRIGKKIPTRIGGQPNRKNDEISSGLPPRSEMAFAGSKKVEQKGLGVGNISKRVHPLAPASGGKHWSNKKLPRVIKPTSSLIKNRISLKEWLSLNWLKIIGYFAVIGATLIVLFLPLLNGVFFSNFGDSLNLYFQKFEFNGSLYYAIRWIGFQVKGYNIIGTLGPVLAITAFLGIIFITLLERPPIWQTLFRSMLFAICCYLFSSATVHPWYVSMPIVFCVFTRFRFPILWSGLIFLTYINYSYGEYFENLWMVGIEYVLVFSYLIYELAFYSNLEGLQTYQTNMAD